MTLTVELMRSSALPELDAAHNAIVYGYNDALRCAAHEEFRYPRRDWLRACVEEDPPIHDVAVVSNDDVPIGIVVVHRDTHQIMWFSYNAAQHEVSYPDALREACVWVRDRHGIAWGVIENTKLRAKVLAAHPGQFVEGERDRFEFVG